MPRLWLTLVFILTLIATVILQRHGRFQLRTIQEVTTVEVPLPLGHAPTPPAPKAAEPAAKEPQGPAPLDELDQTQALAGRLAADPVLSHLDKPTVERIAEIFRDERAAIAKAQQAAAEVKVGDDGAVELYAPPARLTMKDPAAEVMEKITSEFGPATAEAAREPVSGFLEGLANEASTDLVIKVGVDTAPNGSPEYTVSKSELVDHGISGQAYGVGGSSVVGTAADYASLEALVGPVIRAARPVLPPLGTAGKVASPGP